jgi:UDP-N-acetylglucosamine diphosphorylase / glucose-1-phosphate thymidylyltransferase / UDP-N-acetylgalactosamine diphosphorylase / glucosamine-1-phosphate N-acetyltransferase / galactosamine-1-phosphate N-acetyltransferase
MKKTICIFEDEEFNNLLPLVYTRPVYELRCGILTLREKITHYFNNSKFILHTRKYLNDAVKEREPKYIINQLGNENVLFINGRLLINKNTVKQLNKLNVNTIMYSASGSVAAANISADNIKNLLHPDYEFLQFNTLKELSKIESNFNLINYPWDLVNANGSEIENDFDLLLKIISSINLKKYPGVQFKNKKNIFLAKDVIIDPFVFIDAANGPVFIGKNAQIMSHSFIQGPVFIGEGSIVKSHATIYNNTSIGEMCKVGGEVEASIIHSYSNKQHEGFLGHSYLGSWINIGASTNTSDLKNNYGNISVLLNGKPVETKSKFIGLIMGDHSKTAINTMFNTGTIAGVSCNIFGAGFPSRYIPSFSWGGSDFLKTYDINKCIDVARVVMSRRKIELTATEENLIRAIFELTAHERSLKLKS